LHKSHAKKSQFSLTQVGSSGWTPVLLKQGFGLEPYDKENL